MHGGGFQRLKLLLLALGVLLLIFKFLPNASAAQELSQRSIQIGSAVPSINTSHTFNFFVPSISIIGSIVFEYCSNSPLIDQPCTAPAGLNVSSANLTSQLGNAGFSIDNAHTTANRLVISRAPSNSAIINSTYVFTNITNPSSSGATTFVRISTYASTDGTGSFTDNGTTAFATESIFSVGANVPPFIKICVGISVSPNCSTISGDTVDLGVLSPSHAGAGQSQFATGTNSASGYAVYSLGTTMTSGNNIIPALTIPTTNFPGSGQFGINLRANTSPAIGQDPVGLGSATPTANYNTPNRFMFSNGDSLVLASLPSDYNRMTVSYMANIPNGQPSGVYSTTITYLAVAQF